MSQSHSASSAVFLPVILSGGAGTRLWPVSREARPKPFLRLADGESLLIKTLRRASSLQIGSPVLTVTNREHYFQTRDEFATSKTASSLHYLLEPVGRNTAAAALAAARWAEREFGADTEMLILAADHLVEPFDVFADAVEKARTLARQGYLVTFGVVPTSPQTGFGYLQMGEALGDGHRVERFVEKPTREVAETYLAHGGYRWNSGMFCFTAGTLLAQAQDVAPALLASVDACFEASDKVVPMVLNQEKLLQVEDISIDYAIMERSTRVASVDATFRWSDVGAWDAVALETPADCHDNRIEGDGYAVESSNCYIRSESRFVAAVGLEDVMIVDTPDALLVANRHRAQSVKKVVEHLKGRGIDIATQHRTVHRPWGTYTVIEEGLGYKVKRITVKPQQSLSLQMHHHRSEHWVVVSGIAVVENGDREITVHPNESTYIPVCQKHRLRNPGVVDCVMIEVQVGQYLGEDDIVRFTDNYGRVPAQ